MTVASAVAIVSAMEVAAVIPVSAATSAARAGRRPR